MAFRKMSNGLYMADDKFGTKDKFGILGDVQIGFGLKPHPRNPKLHVLDEVLQKKPNQVLMGGSLYALEKIFNVSAQLQVEYLNNILHVAQTGTPVSTRYNREHSICLWTIGNGGAGSSIDDVNDVLQQHRDLMGMLPFRMVDTPFEKGTEEYEKYWLMKQLDNGKYGYYAKTFDSVVVLDALWKDAGDDEDGSAVVEDDWSSSKTTPIETFGEMIMSLEIEDLREWYDYYSNTAGKPRFNTFGLCSGIKAPTSDTTEDYKQVIQCTGVSFSNEPLHMNKTMYILYRLYTK